MDGLLVFMGSSQLSYAHLWETSQLTHYFELYSQEPQQFTRQKSPFAKDMETNTHRN